MRCSPLAWIASARGAHGAGGGGGHREGLLRRRRRELVPEAARQRVPSDLMSLVRKELIHPERIDVPGEDAFRFRHLLIRDSAYDATPKTRRAELHERVADWFERVAGEAVGEQEEIVGYHLEQAHAYRMQLAPATSVPTDRPEGGRPPRNRWAASVGPRRLLRRGEPSEACFDGGPPTDSGRAATLYHLGVALDEVGDIKATFAAFDEAVRLAAASGDRSLEWLARIWRSEVLANPDPHSTSTQECREELEEAIHEFEKLGDHVGLATAWAKLAFLEFIPCRFDLAGGAARRASEHARLSGDDRLLTDALRYLLFSQCFGSATPEDGHRTLDELADDITRTRSLEASALAVRGSFLAMDGSFDKARRLTGLAIEIMEALGSRVMTAVYEAFLGNLEREAHDAMAAERAFRRTYEILDEMGQEGLMSTAAGDLAQVLCTLGRFDEAERLATIARSAATEDDLSSQVSGRSAQAMVLASRGGFDQAERLAHEAVRMLEDAESPGTQGLVRMDLARVLLMAGKVEEAEEAAREALAFFERKGNQASSASTRAFLEDLASSGS